MKNTKIDSAFREVMIENGISTYDELSRWLGVSSSYISNICTGKVRINNKMATRLSGMSSKYDKFFWLNLTKNSLYVRRSIPEELIKYHPGTLLRKVISENHMTITDVARLINRKFPKTEVVSLYSSLQHIINRDDRIGPVIAKYLKGCFIIEDIDWYNVQTTYDALLEEYRSKYKTTKNIPSKEKKNDNTVYKKLLKEINRLSDEVNSLKSNIIRIINKQ